MKTAAQACHEGWLSQEPNYTPAWSHRIDPEHAQQLVKSKYIRQSTSGPYSLQPPSLAVWRSPTFLPRSRCKTSNAPGPVDAVQCQYMNAGGKKILHHWKLRIVTLWPWQNVEMNWPTRISFIKPSMADTQTGPSSCSQSQYLRPGRWHPLQHQWLRQPQR